MYFAHFRMYDPDAKRFQAPDPIRGNIFNPQSLNLYTYVLNSPLNFIDPWGLTPVGLRDAVENAGGNVSWCASSRTATATVDGRTTTFTDGQGGTHITGNRMQVDGNALNNFLRPPPPAAAPPAPNSTPRNNSTVRDAQNAISNTFPPEVWDEMANEIWHHHPYMSVYQVEEIISRTILMIAANYDDFKRLWKVQ
ncbi:MAG: hypothetical protein FWC73_12910, partial [Defluviitaleaceae bacterium]|nr:hypothetical protein [Defluviitaleaceae bacterium]